MLSPTPPTAPSPQPSEPLPTYEPPPSYTSLHSSSSTSMPQPQHSRPPPSLMSPAASAQQSPPLQQLRVEPNQYKYQHQQKSTPPLTALQQREPHPEELCFQDRARIGRNNLWLVGFGRISTFYHYHGSLFIVAS